MKRHFFQVEMKRSLPNIKDFFTKKPKTVQPLPGKYFYLNYLILRRFVQPHVYINEACSNLPSVLFILNSHPLDLGEGWWVEKVPRLGGVLPNIFSKLNYNLFFPFFFLNGAYFY